MREQTGSSLKGGRGKNHSTEGSGVGGAVMSRKLNGEQPQDGQRKRVPKAGSAPRLSRQIDYDAILKKANRGFGRGRSDGYVEWDDAIVAMKAAVRQSYKG